MGFHTPIDKNYRFGELFSIRGTYSRMNESIEMKKLEENFYNSMVSYIIESGNMDKIERFARKNRTLADFTQNNAIEEAYNNAELTMCSLNIPKVVKQKAKKRLQNAISSKSLSIKTNSYNIPSFTKPMDEPTIFESLEDFVDDDKEKIDKIIMDTAKQNGIIGKGENDIGNKDKVSNSKEDEILSPIKHNYAIQSVIIEAVAGNDKKTQLIPVTSIYSESPTNSKVFLNSTIKNVTDGINAICGINFTENEYIWLASGRPVPHFKGELVVTSDVVKGNRLLNTYFGPAGTYKDYLYKADGTPRIEQSKSSEMDYIDVDTNVIESYPIVKVYATVISWDNVNGSDMLRALKQDDFYGTSIRFVD